MADVTWQWDEKTRRYRNPETGRFLNQTQVASLRDQFIEARTTETTTFVGDLFKAAGSIQPGSGPWMTLVNELDRIGWRQVESTMIAEYVQGRGGIKAMTSADLAELRSLIGTQHGYWQNFVSDMRAGRIATQEGIAHRMSLYHQAGRGMHARAQASSWGITLPTYPGEQECGPGCRCSWAITQRKGRVEATWRLGSSSRSCAGCSRNAAQYKPYVIEVAEAAA